VLTKTKNEFPSTSCDPRLAKSFDKSFWPALELANNETDLWVEDICEDQNNAKVNLGYIEYPPIYRSALDFDSIALVALRDLGYQFRINPSKDRNIFNQRLLHVSGPKQLESVYRKFKAKTSTVSRFCKNPSLSDTSPEDMCVISPTEIIPAKQLDPTVTKANKKNLVNRLMMTSILSECVLSPFETGNLNTAISDCDVSTFENLSSRGYTPFSSDEFRTMINRAVMSTILEN